MTAGQKSPIVLCLLPLIASGRAGLLNDALAAEVIAADARLNMWCADQKRRKTDLSTDDLIEQWLEVLDPIEEATKECQAGVEAFMKNSEHKQLAETLTRVRDKLNQRPDW